MHERGWIGVLSLSGQATGYGDYCFQAGRRLSLSSRVHDSRNDQPGFWEDGELRSESSIGPIVPVKCLDAGIRLDTPATGILEGTPVYFRNSPMETLHGRRLQKAVFASEPFEVRGSE